MTQAQRKKFVDFAQLKREVSMEDVVSFYRLIGDFQRKGKSLRGCCPIHGGTNKRHFVINTKKNEWFCHGDCQEGGDIIQFVASYQDLTNYAAAVEISEMFGAVEKPKKRVTRKSGRSKEKTEEDESETSDTASFKPLKFLVVKHDALQEVGISPNLASKVGCGYTPRGVLRGNIAFPVRTEDGTLIGYIGIPPDTELIIPKSLQD